MSLIEKLNWRYATKRMNGTKVPQEKIDTILEAIRLTPTSYGLQSFKVFVISDEKLKEKIFDAAYQQPQIKEASHVLVFAAIKDVNAEIADKYIEKIATIRSTPVDVLTAFRSRLDGVVNGNAEQNFKWTSRQTYIALGVALVAAADQHVDATPMEGFSNEALDKILELDKQNLGSVSILALGYRDVENDKLAQAPKVRKSKEELIEVIC